MITQKEFLTSFPLELLINNQFAEDIRTILKELNTSNVIEYTETDEGDCTGFHIIIPTTRFAWGMYCIGLAIGQKFGDTQIGIFAKENQKLS